MSRILTVLLAAAIIVGVWPREAAAHHGRIDVTIDLSQQRMYVYRGKRLLYKWAISSGRSGYRTPTGTYRPKWLSPNHRSSKYNNAPMPYSIFFRGGYAIHGTNHVKRLGRPASHGCVRLHTANARRLFRLVQTHGKRNVRIRIRR